MRALSRTANGLLAGLVGSVLGSPPAAADEVVPFAPSLALSLLESLAPTLSVDPQIASGLAVALLAALAAVVLVIVRKRRVRGSVSIEIGFADRIDGEFRVSVSRAIARATRTTRSTRGDRSASRKSAPPARSPRQLRSGVARETQFGDLGKGRWTARIEGLLRAPKSGVELARIQDEFDFEIDSTERVFVRRRLADPKVPVELRVHWDRQPARDIGVCERGQPESLRYAGHSVVRLALPLGDTTLLIGSGDRVVARDVVVEDFEPVVTSVDLAMSEGLIFKGCPPAVSAFLQGDLGGAARSLERDGQHDVASRLLAELHQEQGQTAHAAEALESAGQLEDAARLRESIGDYAHAAALFERAGLLAETADLFERAEAHAEAARVLVMLEDWPRAASAYEAAGDHEGLLAALEAQGAYLRAAALASERDDRGRAIQLLKRVAPQDPDHGRASELLVFAYEQEGHFDLAANELERRLDRLGPDEPPAQLELHLAELYEELDDCQRALATLARLREREPAFPQIATRIEGLRKKLSQADRRGTTQEFTPPPGATAFVTRSRYQVLEEIGSGGMGRVYRARDERLGREVALKRMPENLRDHPTAVSLFLGEARAAARMNHPNIVTLYDADQEEGVFFITMELLHGLPLNAVLKQHGPFGPRDMARLGLQACAGLAYAHDEGIIHRDIKTANFFITRDRALKIMDFGLAKMIEAVRGQGATVIAGTPFYMAPEQSSGAPIDPRADLYALGVTFFELATGAVPFEEGDIAQHHRATRPPALTELIPGFPGEIASLVARLLEKDPADRPASATEVGAVLSTYLDGEI